MAVIMTLPEAVEALVYDGNTADLCRTEPPAGGELAALRQLQDPEGKK